MTDPRLDDSAQDPGDAVPGIESRVIVGGDRTEFAVTVPTVRLDLSPFKRDDFKLLITWVPSREALFQWAGGSFDFPLDERQLQRHLAESPQSRRLPFTVLQRSSLEPVGYLELTELDRSQGSVSLARVILDPRRRRMGLGAGMVSKALEMAFHHLRLHRVSLRVFQSNAAAIACYERVGFVGEGFLRDAGRLDGTYRGALVMGLLEHEWRARTAEDAGVRAL